MQKGDDNLLKLYRDLGNFNEDFRNKNLVKLILTKIKGNKVLDVGAGAGYLLSEVRKTGMEVWGIEQNPDLIDMARKLFGDLRIELGEAERLVQLYPSSKFDCVTSTDVLEHIKNDELVISHVYNLLEPMGVFVVVVPAMPGLYGKRDKELGHYRRYSRKELVSKLKTAGFVIEEARYWGALGVLPYWFAEKVLGGSLKTGDLRNSEKHNLLSRVVNTILDKWFSLIENNVSFGFGLSLMVVARKG